MRTTKTNKILNLVAANDKKPSALPENSKNPLVRIPEKDEVPIIFVKDAAGFQVINVGFLLINEQLGAALERFNCCSCPECAAAVTAETLKNLPPIIITADRKSDAYKVNLLAAKHRSEITRIITKAVISLKSSPKYREHTKKD